MYEDMMKRRDVEKASLVDFLSSLKFSRNSNAASKYTCDTRFASFEQRIKTGRQLSPEESQLIRSAN
jgi:hypothetical protein